MIQIEKFWNLIHFYNYLFQCFLGRMISAFDPTAWIFRLPWFTKQYKKGGIDNIETFTKKMSEHFVFGTSVNLSGIIVGAVLCSYLMGVFLLVSGLSELKLMDYVVDNVVLKIVFTIILVLVVVAINNRLLFNGNKYLSYFKKFKSHSLTEQFLYGLLTVLVTIGGPVFFMLAMTTN